MFKLKEGFLSLNPCLEYKIYLKIVAKNRVTTYKDSGSVLYNDVSRQNIVSLYGGFLLEEKYTNNVCLKKTGVITFPHPPKALSDCFLTRGDKIAEEFTARGQSHQVPIKIRHPRNEKELTFTADVNKIEQCASNTTLENIKKPTPPSNKDQDPAQKSTNPAMIYIVSISGTLLFAALVTSVVCCIKKKKKRTPIGQSYDVNPVYGTVYYHQDR